MTTKKVVEVEGFDGFLDFVNDTQREKDLIVSLVRKGWIREDGTLAVDLQVHLDEAVEEAFKDPFVI